MISNGPMDICPPCLFSHLVVQTKVSSDNQLAKLNFTGLFEMVRAFVILLPKGMTFFFITPLSAPSEKKVKPKSITFDKQCLV